MPHWPNRATAGARGPIAVLVALPLALVLVAALIWVGAVVDHRRKQERLHALQVAAWYCSHRGTQCGSEPWQALEARWNRRELSYQLAVVAITATAAGIAGAMWRRRAPRGGGLPISDDAAQDQPAARVGRAPKAMLPSSLDG